MLATLGVLLRLCCHPALIPQYVVRTADGSTKLAPELPAAGDASDDDVPALEDSNANNNDDNNDDDDEDEAKAARYVAPRRTAPADRRR